MLSSVCFSQISNSRLPAAKPTVLKPENTMAYFVVTINGFSCNSETWDDALERDGKRDEVYLMCKTITLQQQNGKQNIVSEQLKKTVVFGDVNNRSLQENRAQAGNADGYKGGIKTGDNVPSNQPWKKTLNPSNEYLPLLVYQGLLSSNNNTTVQIIPSIWEWDGPPDFLNKAMELINKPFTDIVNLTAGNDPVRQMIVTRANQDFHFYNILLKRTPAPGTEVIVNRNVFGDPKDRPVGMLLNAVTNQYLYFPVGLQLNYETASTIAETDMGYGKGIFGMQFRDHQDLKGDYTIYIQIEKIAVQGQSLNIQPRIIGNFQPNKLYIIKNAETGKFLATAGTGDASSSISMTDDVNSAAAKWRIRKVADNYFIITNEQNGRNLTYYDRGDGSFRLSLYDQNGNNQQQWKLTTQADGSYILFNRESVDKPVYHFSGMAGPAISRDINNMTFSKWFIEENK